jgi:Flp pilus assembly protein TadG
MRRAARTRGSAMVEMTLAMPLLVVLFLGIWEFGYACYLYNDVEQAVRAGARFASGYNRHQAQWEQAVQNMVAYGTPAGGTKTIIPGLNPATHVKVATDWDPKGNPLRVRVAIDGYSVGTFGMITLHNKPQMELPYVGAW